MRTYLFLLASLFILNSNTSSASETPLIDSVEKSSLLFEAQCQHADQILHLFDEAKIDLYQDALRISRERYTYAQTAYELLTSEATDFELKFKIATQIEPALIFGLSLNLTRSLKQEKISIVTNIIRFSEIQWGFMCRSLENYNNIAREKFPFEQMLFESLFGYDSARYDICNVFKNRRHVSTFYISEYKATQELHDIMLLLSKRYIPQVLSRYKQLVFAHIFEIETVNNIFQQRTSIDDLLVGMHCLRRHSQTHAPANIIKHQIEENNKQDFIDLYKSVGTAIFYPGYHDEFLQPLRAQANLNALVERGNLKSKKVPFLEKYFISTEFPSLNEFIKSQVALKPEIDREEINNSFLSGLIAEKKHSPKKKKKKKKSQKTDKSNQVPPMELEEVSPVKTAGVETSAAVKNCALETKHKPSKKDKERAKRQLIINAKLKRAEEIEKQAQNLDISVSIEDGFCPQLKELFYYKLIWSNHFITNQSWTDFSGTLLKHGWRITNGQGSLRTLHAPYWLSQVQTQGKDALQVNQASLLVHKPHRDSDILHPGLYPFIQKGFEHNLGLSEPMLDSLIRLIKSNQGKE